MIQNGRVFKIINDEKFVQIVVRKKSFNRYRLIAFTGFDKTKSQIISEKINKGDYVRIEYDFSSKKYQTKNNFERYTTSAIIENVSLTQKSPENINTIFVDKETGEIIET